MHYRNSEGIFLKAVGGPVVVKSLTLWPLKSAVKA